MKESGQDVIDEIVKRLRRIENLSAWCREHNLNYTHTSNVKNGIRKHLQHSTVSALSAALGIEMASFQAPAFNDRPANDPRETFRLRIQHADHLSAGQRSAILSICDGQLIDAAHTLLRMIDARLKG
jgi:hypothetical protein